jgi:hypothetical protein
MVSETRPTLADDLLFFRGTLGATGPLFSYRLMSLIGITLMPAFTEPGGRFPRSQPRLLHGIHN